MVRVGFRVIVRVRARVVFRVRARVRARVIFRVRVRVACSSGSTCVTRPQSRMHSVPSAVRKRLPGCGSQCSSPVSSNIVR